MCMHFVESDQPSTERSHLRSSPHNFWASAVGVANPSTTLYVDSAVWKQGNLDRARTKRFCWSALTEKSMDHEKNAKPDPAPRLDAPSGGRLVPRVASQPRPNRTTRRSRAICLDGHSVLAARRCRQLLASGDRWRRSLDPHRWSDTGALLVPERWHRAAT